MAIFWPKKFGRKFLAVGEAYVVIFWPTTGNEISSEITVKVTRRPKEPLFGLTEEGGGWRKQSG